MKGLLASHRRRRRAAKLGGAVLMAGVLTLLGVYFSNTGHEVPSVYKPGPVARVPPNPKADPFTPSERRQVRAVAARFVASAVLRKNTGDSWEIATAQLRQGLSHTQWASGSIPVVPYPADAIAEVRWRLNYSYARTVGMKVAFFPKPGAQVNRQVFDIELQNAGSAAKPRWLVSDWVPSGGVQLSTAAPGGAPATVGTSHDSIRPIWLLAPVGLIVGSMLTLLLWLGLRGWIRTTRANRAYLKS
jgi:hypothetical protein